MFLLLMEDVFAPVIQIIETISAVDKDEMGHRQHFTFSLAPEVAHNHNFSIKDNRGKPFDSYFGLFTEYSSFCGAALGVFFLFPRLDQSVTRWRLATLVESSRCSESLTHKCTRILRAVLIAVGSPSVCTYFFGGPLIELSVEIAVREVKGRDFKEWRREARSEDENAGTTSFENRSCSRPSLIR